jgi:hypothetical protein
VFELIFVTLFVTAWLICGFIPWLVLSVATKGEAGLGNLPLCLFAGVVAGMAVPLLGKDDWAGIWLSFLAAAAVPAMLLGARRFATAGLRTRSTPVPSSTRTVPGPKGDPHS